MSYIELTENIYRGFLDKAVTMAENLSPVELYEAISDKAYETKDILFYGFMVQILFTRPQSQLADLHFNAALLLSVQLCQIPGAYDLAEYHVHKALSLSPDHEEYQKYLAHLKTVPR